MDNRKASYITPRISNLIHHPTDDTLLNIPSISYDSFCFDNNNNNTEKHDSNMISVQGDDPPQRLVIMPAKGRALKEICSNALSLEKNPCPPYSPTSSLSSYETNESDSQRPIIVRENSPDHRQSPFSCLVVFDALEHTAGTTRRGRPPVTEEYNPDSQLRFVKPTVCGVNTSKRRKIESKNKSAATANVNTFMTSFTNANMSMEFDNPIKKRGRKPKSQIQGNSFFVLRNTKSPT